MDPNQFLYYDMELLVNGTVPQQLSNHWLTFDNAAIRIFGTSKSDDLLSECEAGRSALLLANRTNVYGENVTLQQQVCNVSLRLSVSDNYIEERLFIDFIVQIFNYVPYVYFPVHNQTEYLSKFRKFHFYDTIYCLLQTDTVVDLDVQDVVTIYYWHNYSSV